MRLFLATNTTNVSLEAIKQVKPKNLLFSYYYLKGKDKAFIEDIFGFCLNNGIKIFLDSGAFSFMLNKDQDHSMNFFRGFAQEYITFIQEYYKYIFCYAELDVDLVIGYMNVLYLRKLFPKEILGKMLPVFHPETRTFNDWKKDCSEFEYLALGSTGDVTSAKSFSYYAKFLGHSHKNGNRVHGFALINQLVLKTFPFYSADSSSWTSGNIYGNFPIFDIKKGKITSGKYNNFTDIAKYIPYLLQNCPNFLKLYNQNNAPKSIMHVSRLIIGASAYMELEKYLTKLWTAKGVTWNI